MGMGDITVAQYEQFKKIEEEVKNKILQSFVVDNNIINGRIDYYIDFTGEHCFSVKFNLNNESFHRVIKVEPKFDTYEAVMQKAIQSFYDLATEKILEFLWLESRKKLVKGFQKRW